MNTDLTRVALRYSAIYVPAMHGCPANDHESKTKALALAATLARCGYTLSEAALKATETFSSSALGTLVGTIQSVYGIGLNWAPLVKDWERPTFESPIDHLATLFANLFPLTDNSGVELPCGHFIPDGTFPIERYNGCPFCGRPFTLSSDLQPAQGSRRKVLGAMTDDDLRRIHITLLTSPVPLDATQLDSLVRLTKAYGLPPGVDVPMKESAAAIAIALEETDRLQDAQRLFKTPDDLLRMIWYAHTGRLKIIPPKVLAARAAAGEYGPQAKEDAIAEAKDKLKLHFSRPTCAIFARWLNEMPLSPADMCENMHPRREMWVRVIRALRLSEYARKCGHEKLAEMLDRFYRKDYRVWAGSLEKSRLNNNTAEVFRLLEERPGLYARALFSTMLRMGSEPTCRSFSTVADRVPARLLLALTSFAPIYFLPETDQRLIALPDGKRVAVPINKALGDYSIQEKTEMVADVKGIFIDEMRRRYRSLPHVPGQTVYISPALFSVPVPVGDRSETVQDTSCALSGQIFKVEGSQVRLFLHWGKGLPAQHLDMDLSCRLIKDEGEDYECAYYSLTVPGAQHSGDIREIPDLVGTAEYINLDIDTLDAEGVKYAVFTCNAYSASRLSPNLVVGWMDSRHPMTVSNETGVAYDPSAVSHQVRISETNLTRGLVFGVLDVRQREIIWLELPFGGRNLPTLDSAWVHATLKRLKEKISYGELLSIRADAQEAIRVDSPGEADCVFLTPADASDLI